MCDFLRRKLSFLVCRTSGYRSVIKFLLICTALPSYWKPIYEGRWVWQHVDRPQAWLQLMYWEWVTPLWLRKQMHGCTLCFSSNTGEETEKIKLNNGLVILKKLLKILWIPQPILYFSINIIKIMVLYTSHQSRFKNNLIKQIKAQYLSECWFSIHTNVYPFLFFHMYLKFSYFCILWNTLVIYILEF